MAIDIVVTDDPNNGGAGREQKFPAGLDRPYRISLWILAGLCGAVVLLFAYSIISQSIPGWKTVGFSFFTSTNWNYSAGDYGALSLIFGTLATTAIALLFAIPIGVGCALAIQFVLPRQIRLVFASIVDLLAFVPSIVYGVWGYLVIGPWLSQTVEPWLASLTNGGPPFQGAQVGIGLLLGSIVLAVMILPTITAISRDVVGSIPNDLIEGSLSLGASRGQVLRKVIVPSSRTGILGAIVLGTGRALGETIAMVLLLGGINATNPIPKSVFGTTATLASEIASNFGNLTGASANGILYCLALVLMVIVAGVNLAARSIVARNLRKLR